jgi:hypothetical protein
VLGTQYIPTGTHPTLGQKLPDTHAYLSWSAPSAVPEGKTLDHYEACWAKGTVFELGTESECPNQTTTADMHAVIHPLQAGTQYFWKVRAHYADGDFSYFTYAQPFRTDASLIGWWEMNGNGNDSSSATHNGSVQNGASFVTGHAGDALKLDGVNDFMIVSDDPSFDFGTNDFAFSAWVFLEETGANQAIIEKRNGTNGYLISRRSTGNLRFQGDGCGAFDGGPLGLGAWHHIAASRTVTGVTLYIDGQSAGSGACNENFSNNAVLTFGCNTPTNGCAEPVKGSIDDVVFLDREATAATVLNEYCAGMALSGASPMPASCQ